jgi:hypothetical protein
MKRVRRGYELPAARQAARQAAYDRQREPFQDLLSISVKEMSHEELATRILDRLQQLQRTTDLTHVAWWVASLRTKRGRPRGRRTELLARARAAEWIKVRLKRRKRWWCRDHERVRVPRDVTTSLIKELIAAAAKQYPGITPFDVGEFLRDK